MLIALVVGTGARGAAGSAVPDLGNGDPVVGTVEEGDPALLTVDLVAGDFAYFVVTGPVSLWMIAPSGSLTSPAGVSSDLVTTFNVLTVTETGRWTVEVDVSPFEDVSTAAYTIEFVGATPNRGATAAEGGPVPIPADEVDDASAPTPALFLGSSALGEPSVLHRTGRFGLDLLLLAAPLGVFFAVREVTVLQVRKRMMRRSAPDTGSPDRGSGEPAADVPPPIGLSLVESGTGATVITTGAASDRLLRTQRQLRLMLLGHVAGLAGFVAVSFGVAAHYGGAVDAVIVASLPLVMAVVLWLAWVLRATGVPIGALSVAMAAVLLLACVAAARASGALFLLPWVPFAGAVVLAYRGRGVASAAVGKQDVVVLRIFESDHSAATTFGTLAHHWRLLGPVLTIADPSFVRYQYSPFIRTNRFRLVVLVGLVVGLGVTIRSDALRPHVTEALRIADRPRSDQDRIMGIVAALLAVPVAAVPVVVAVRLHFCRHREVLLRRIDERLGAGSSWHGGYRVTPLYCHDDLWRPAVDRMLDGGEVILMDLRGLRPTNLGCAYEIGKVVDRVPVHRVVVVLDDRTDRDTVFRLFGERWRAMAIDSPNRNVRRAELKVYTGRAAPARSDPRRARLAGVWRRRRQWALDAAAIVGLMATAPDADGVAAARVLRVSLPSARADEPGRRSDDGDVDAGWPAPRPSGRPLEPSPAATAATIGA